MCSRIHLNKKTTEQKGWVQWHTPLIPAFTRQRQVDSVEFGASLAYIISSRQARLYNEINTHTYTKQVQRRKEVKHRHNTVHKAARKNTGF